LLDIWLGIARDNPSAADRIYDRLEARIRILARYPEIGRARPDIADDCRMVVEHPYIILYRATAAGVQIVRVLHGARDIGSDLFDEGLR
jgi:toxin ParE1/3/4